MKEKEPTLEAKIDNWLEESHSLALKEEDFFKESELISETIDQGAEIIYQAASSLVLGDETEGSGLVEFRLEPKEEQTREFPGPLRNFMLNRDGPLKAEIFHSKMSGLAISLEKKVGGQAQTLRLSISTGNMPRKDFGFRLRTEAEEPDEDYQHLAQLLIDLRDGPRTLGAVRIFARVAKLVSEAGREEIVKSVLPEAL